MCARFSTVTRAIARGSTALMFGLLIATNAFAQQTWSKTVDDQWGTDQAGAAIQASARLEAGADAVSATSGMTGRVMIFHFKPQIANGEAHATATRLGADAGVSVRVAGFDVIHETHACTFTGGDGKCPAEKVFGPRPFQRTITLAEYQFQVGPIPVHVRANIGGAAELPFRVRLSPLALSATSTPRTYAFGTLEGGVGFRFLTAAKLTADLHMLDTSLDFGGELQPNLIVRKIMVLTIEPAHMMVKAAAGLFIDVKFRIFKWKVKIKKQLKTFETTLFDKSWGRRVYDFAPPPPRQQIAGGTRQSDVVVNAGNTSAPKWRVVSPALPSGFVVAAGWARNARDVYMIGSRTVNGSLPETFLFHWDGAAWSEAFYLANASAISVFGTGASEVLLSAYYAPRGPSVVMHSADNGHTWALQSLPPAAAQHYLGNFDGTVGNIQASAGVANTIVRFDGKQWSLLSAGGTSDVPGPIAVLSEREAYYTTCKGWGAFNGVTWTFHPGFDFCDTANLYGARDPSTNKLLLLTAGNQNFSNGIRVWQFNGSGFGSKCGTVLAEPNNGPYVCGGVFAGRGSYGSATGLFGVGANDVYLTGRLGYPSATGRLYHYDGRAWENLTNSVSAILGGTLPVTTTVFGSKEDIWVPLADGRLLHYAR